MANFTDDKINLVWGKAKKVVGVDPEVWRKDVCDAWINREQYGKESDYGWEVDHALPVAKEGTDHADNLRAMHWQNNRSKSDDFPDYNSSITSNNNKNIEQKDSKTVNKDTIVKLKIIYPSNPYLKDILID